MGVADKMKRGVWVNYNDLKKYALTLSKENDKLKSDISKLSLRNYRSAITNKKLKQTCIDLTNLSYKQQEKADSELIAESSLNADLKANIMEAYYKIEELESQIFLLKTKGNRILTINFAKDES